MSDVVFTDHALKLMNDFIRNEMIKAAEPLIKEAIDKIEKELRTSVAKSVLIILDKEYSMERLGSNLKIIVKHQGDNQR